MGNINDEGEINPILLEFLDTDSSVVAQQCKHA